MSARRVVVLSAMILALLPAPAQAARRDRTPPTGTVAINGGAAYTNNAAVTLTLTAQDNPGGSGMVGGKAGMQVRNDNPKKWPKNGWEPFQQTKSWTLLAGEGTKTVYVKYRDKAGNKMNAPTTDTIIVDLTPPTTPGAPTEGSPDQDYDSDGGYTVHWSAASDPQSGISAYELQEKVGLGAWATLSATLAATSYSVANRLHNSRYTYRVRAVNAAGTWGPWSFDSDGLLVDTSFPATTVSGIDGAWHSSPVTVTLTATDTASGVEKTLYSTDGTHPPTTPYTGPFTLRAQGVYTLWYFSVDKAGNTEPVQTAADPVKIDTTAPTGTVTINDGAAYTTSATVTLTLTATDPGGSGMGTGAQMRLTNDKTTWSNWESYAVTKTWTLRAGDGLKTVTVQLKDVAGNPSTTEIRDTITLDASAPQAPSTPTEGSPDQDYDSDGAYTVYWGTVPSAASYELQEKVGLGAWATLSATLAATSYSVANRLHNSRYTYRVRAVNAAGTWGAWSVESDGIQVDTTAPTSPVVTDDGTHTASTTTLHATWTSSDPDSGLAEFQYAIGTTAGGTNTVGWTSAGLATEVTRTGLVLAQGGIYYVSVKARNGAGAWSAAGVSDGITVDTTPPTTPVVTDDGEITDDRTAIHARWAASDAESGVSTFWYAIGTSPGSTEVVPWTSVGTATEVRRSGLRLIKGPTYYVAVKAVNGVGLESAVGVSDGIRVANAPPTLEPIGDKLIRVQPPPKASAALSPPPGDASGQPATAGPPANSQVLMIKLKAEVTTPFESFVQSGQRLRAKASPAHLQRLSAAPHRFSLEELCARHRVMRSEPLFQAPAASAVKSQAATPAGPQQAAPDIGLDRIFRMEVPGDLAGDALLEFSQHPSVEYCEPRLRMETFVTPNDPYLTSSGSWGQNYPDLWGLKRIEAERAWDTTAGASDVVVAVIDTGIDLDHPDLFPNLWRNPGEIPGNGHDDDRNGYVDDVWGWDFDAGDRDPSDGHGHGTHVAGTIAAVGNNGQGVIGVAWRSRVMALKGLSDEGYGFSDNLAQAIAYAAGRGAKVINMSWGGQGRSKVIEDVLRSAHAQGVVLVAAAGNSNADAAGFTPANIEQVITVAATDHTDHKAPFSNWGSKIDVAAPGGDGNANDGTNRAGANILSCRANGTDMYGDGTTVLGEHARVRGTSMAAPHVAGLCALIRSHHPEFSPEDVRQIFRASADDIVDPLNDGTHYPGLDPYTGAGRINAPRALGFQSAPRAQITAPRPDTALSEGQVEIRGSAAGPSFQHYSVAFGKGRNPQMWTEIGRSTTPVANGLLARWGLSSQEYATYTLRLQVWLAGSASPAEHRVVVRKTRPLFPGWPVVLKGGSYKSLVAVADLDHDGQVECFVFEGPIFSAYQLHAFDLQGRERPGWPVRLGISGESAHLAIGDLDGDGDQELLIPTVIRWNQLTQQYDAALLRLQADGTNYPGWPWYFPGTTLGKPLLLDLDGDALLEIAVPAGTQLFCFRANGDLIPGWPRDVPGHPTGTSLLTADLDGDGAPELVKYGWALADGTVRHSIIALRGDGTVLPGWPIDVRDDFSEGFVAADLDSDGDDELVGYRSVPGQYYAWGGDGRLLPGWPIVVPSRSLGTPPVVADLDGDGLFEILGGIEGQTGWFSSSPGLTGVWTLDGALAPGWPQPSSIPGWPGMRGGVVVPADLDRDGTPEIVSVSPSDGVVTAFRVSGEKLEGWPVRPAWSSSWPAFGDVDGDGLMEVVVAAYQVFAFKPNGMQADGWPIDPGAFVPVMGLLDADSNGDLELFAASQERSEWFFAFLWDLPFVPLLPEVERPSNAVGKLPIPVIDGNARVKSILVYPPGFRDGQRGTLILQLRGKDTDHDRLAYGTVGLPPGSLWNARKGFFRWRPTAEQAGTYRVTFSVTDGEATASETIAIIVRAGNQKPALTVPAPSYTVDEAQPLEFALQATDPDGDLIQFLGHDLPRGATLDRRTGKFLWRPDYTQAGTYLLSLAASDGSLEDRQTVRVTVRNVNRAPTLAHPGDATRKEGQILEFLLNAVDPDGDPVTFSATPLPPGATLLPDTGLFSWQPTFQQAGAYGPITVTVSDGSLSATQSFMITVQDVPPWTTAPAAPTVNVDQLRTPTNVPTQKLSGAKSAYTAVLVNGVEVIPRDRLTSWETTITLVEGVNAIAVRVRDIAGLISDPVVVTIDLDTTPPAVTVTSPTPGQVIPLTGGGGSG